MCAIASHTVKGDILEANPGIINYVGTMHSRNLTFYKMNGQYFVRSKSSLTRKRVKRAACFKKTREFAAKLGRASSIASGVYKQLPAGWKLHSLYRKLTGIGFQLLKAANYTDNEIAAHLWQYLYELGYNATIEYEEIPDSTEKFKDSDKRRKPLTQRIRQRRQHILKQQQRQPFLLRTKVSLYTIPELNIIYSGSLISLIQFPLARSFFPPDIGYS